MLQRGACAFLIVAVASVFIAQRAAAVTLVTDERIVKVKDSFSCPMPMCPPPPYSSISPAPPFSTFNQTIAFFDSTASQNTVVSASAMSGSLSTSTAAFTSGFEANAESRFQVTFDATVSTPYTWTGTGVGGVFASLVDVTTSGVVFQTTSAGALNNSGTLTAGHRYRVILVANTFNFGSPASWTFNYTTTAAPSVPLDPRPVALALLVGLLVSLQRIRSRV